MARTSQTCFLEILRADCQYSGFRLNEQEAGQLPGSRLLIPMQFICGGNMGERVWLGFNSSKYMAATCQVISFARLDGSTHVLFISFEVGELLALGHWFLLLGCHKTEEPLNGYGLHHGMNYVLRCVPSLDKTGLVLWIMLHWGGTHVGITPIYGDVYVYNFTHVWWKIAM